MVKPSWKRRNAVGNTKLDGPFSCSRSHIDRLDDIVNTYNNTYHRTIKMKPVDVKSSTYFNFNRENNREGPKYEVGDDIRISKYKIFLQKVMSRLV